MNLVYAGQISSFISEERHQNDVSVISNRIISESSGIHLYSSSTAIITGQLHDPGITVPQKKPTHKEHQRAKNLTVID